MSRRETQGVERPGADPSPATRPTIDRRAFGIGLGAAAASLAATIWMPRRAEAFGEEGAFNPRVLLTGNARWEGVRTTAPARWSAELVGRTSAPARKSPGTVRADEPVLLAEPFAIWGGDSDIPRLTEREVSGLKRFLALGGVLFVDDFAPDASPSGAAPGAQAASPTAPGAFTRAAKRELERVIPEGSPILLDDTNVLFKSFYRVRRPEGRVVGPAKLEAVVRGGLPQVIFSAHDLLGALAQVSEGVDTLPIDTQQREQAIRLAVNIAMFVLCSNYKDDQVHASYLLKRKGAPTP